MKRFYVVVENGARFPMKQWLRENSSHVPNGLDPTSSTSHALRNGLKKNGWQHQEFDSEELLIQQGVEIEILPEDVDREQDDESPSFVLEEHLRAFLSENIGSIKILNKNLKVFVNQEGKDGVEYPTAVGFIDILAIDEDENFYVFELKRSRGSDKVIGQIARYMGWVSATIGKDKKVCGVIVANTIDDKLRYAASVFPNVFLFEYQLEFHLKEASKINIR